MPSTPTRATLPVLWVTHCFPRCDGDIAGHFLLTLARALRARGVDVRVIAPADALATPPEGAAILDGVPVWRVPYAGWTTDPLAYTGCLCAWGNIGALLERDRQVYTLIAAAAAELLCLGITKTGAPRHPLYVRADTVPAPWSHRPDRDDA